MGIVKSLERDYIETINSDEFKEFERKFLKKYYGKGCFTTFNINGHIIEVPGFYYLYNDIKAADSIFDFDDMVKLRADQLFDVESDTKNQNAVKKTDYIAFNSIVGKNVKRPDALTYMLEAINLNNERIKNVICYTDAYKQHVYTSYILKYELYKTFKKYGNKIDDDVYWEDIKKYSYIRNSVFEGTGNTNMSKGRLTYGSGRNSMVGVQMLVLIKNKNGGYDVKLTKRSDKVSNSPGFYQLIPSGGFETLERKESNASIDCSIGSSIFKEYAEELFDVKEVTKSSLSLKDVIEGENKVKEVQKMINNKEALFTFMGICVSLDCLCYDFCFLLIINNPDYINNTFKANDESDGGMMSIDINEFEYREDILSKTLTASAVMWKMFNEVKHNDNIKNFIETKNYNFEI